MRLFYTLIVKCYYWGALIASLWSDKAKKWIEGRRNISDVLKKNSDQHRPILFHCASLGEFEQGKPLMERIKKDHPDLKIWVTFFSPSGYEIRKNDPVADVITYLPIDTPHLAKQFVEIVKPQQVFFVKYEYWYNLMRELYANDIPFYYVSAIFRPQQLFFRKVGRWFAEQLKQASAFFVQNEESLQLLNKIGIENVYQTGDTRFDRVHAIAMQQSELKFVTEFKSNAGLLVAGSTWSPDEELLLQLLKKMESASFNYKMIIAPHQIDEPHIQDIVERYKDFKVLRYTEMENSSLANADLLIIDQIGLLSKIFRYSDLSYVGGAFETGLHNILEPAVYGVPLFFGPKYAKFNEAKELVKEGGAFSVRNEAELWMKVALLVQDEKEYQRICHISKEYVKKNVGSVDKIVKQINFKDRNGND